MGKYKVVLHYENGDDEQDEVFDSEDAAEEYGEYLLGCSSVGAETLNLSNPGDYDFDNYDKPDYEVIEI